MRTVRTEEITAAVKEMCINANLFLADDVKGALYRACDNESAELGRKILGQLKENLEIAGNDSIPICQDTGMAVVFVKLGQEVHIEGGSFNAAINEGVRQGYTEGYLRKSVVSDPLIRINTKDNTPAIIHVEIVDGDKVEITIAPKGFGSENMSRVFMLKPADGVKGVKDAVLTAVKDAGPNACPPVVVGVGIGGDFEKAAILAKKALTRHFGAGTSAEAGFEANNSEALEASDAAGRKLTSEEIIKKAAAGDGGSYSGTPDAVSGFGRPEYADVLERELFEEINKLNIGPGGMGGKNTCLGVNVETYPTHIAGLPLAVNMCCHVNRHVTRII